MSCPGKKGCPVFTSSPGQENVRGASQVLSLHFLPYGLKAFVSDSSCVKNQSSSNTLRIAPSYFQVLSLAKARRDHISNRVFTHIAIKSYNRYPLELSTRVRESQVSPQRSQNTNISQFLTYDMRHAPIASPRLGRLTPVIEHIPRHQKVIIGFPMTVGGS